MLNVIESQHYQQPIDMGAINSFHVFCRRVDKVEVNHAMADWFCVSINVHKYKNATKVNKNINITIVFATRRKNFSQWHRSFQRKLLSHWLKFLRHVAITLVIQGPGSQYQENEHNPVLHKARQRKNCRSWTRSFSYTLSREYRVVRYRYSRLLFTSEDRLCANLHVQEQSTNMTSQCQCPTFAWRHISTVVTSQY